MTRRPHGSHTGVRGGCPTHRFWQAKRLPYNLFVASEKPRRCRASAPYSSAESNLRHLFEVGYETAKEFNHETLHSAFRDHDSPPVVCIRAIGNAARVTKYQERTRGQADDRKISDNLAETRCFCAGENLGR